MKLTCYSGGAKGSDKFFGDKTTKIGGLVNHYYIDGYKTPYGNSPKVLDKESTKTIDSLLSSANKYYLHRTYPTSSSYVNSLLRRNYFQVNNTDAVYAISSFDGTGKVKGGTAWAVYMAILLNVPEIFVFDQYFDRWFMWDNEKFIKADPVQMKSNFTGIGSRNLTNNGKEAITDLFKTLKL